MRDYSRIDPNSLDGKVCLVHFSWRFPTNVYSNNMRVDQGYTDNPAQMFDRTNLTIEQLEIDDVTLDLDYYLLCERISIEVIDEKIRSFYLPNKKGPYLSSEPHDYLSFFELAKFVFDYLCKEGHDPEDLTG